MPGGSLTSRADNVEPCLRSPGASRGEAGLRGYLFTVQVVPGYH